MRIGEFEFTDNGDRFKMKYVGPKPIYDNSWLKKAFDQYKEAEAKLHTQWETWTFTAPTNPYEMFIEYCKHDVEATKELCKAMEEKETAMEKDMKDYIGCYLKEVEFKPPYTTILWGDGTATQVKCIDEPYDPEKGFAMAIQKKLFGNNYYKDMKNIISRNAGYAKANRLVHIMCGEYFGYEDSTAKTEEIEKLKKENECLKRSNELMSNNIQSLVKDINDLRAANDKLSHANGFLRKENEHWKMAVKAKKGAIDLLQQANICLGEENEDLKKAKENMAKKLAETKSLRRENAKLKLHLDALNEQLSDCRNANYVQSSTIDYLRMDRIGLEKKLEKANAAYKDIVDMQKQYDELKEQYDLLTECHKRQAFTIGKQREEVEKLNKIKEILK